jgi:hypothetical protein
MTTHMKNLKNLFIVGSITGCLLLTSCSKSTDVKEIEKDVKELMYNKCLLHGYEDELQRLQNNQYLLFVDRINQLNSEIPKQVEKINSIDEKLSVKYTGDDLKKYKELCSIWIDKCDELRKMNPEDISTTMSEEEKQQVKNEREEENKQEQQKLEQEEKRKSDFSKTILGTWNLKINGTPCKMIFKEVEIGEILGTTTGHVKGEFIINGKSVEFMNISRYSTSKEEENKIKIEISLNSEDESNQEDETEKQEDYTGGSFILNVQVNSYKGNGEWFLERYGIVEKRYNIELSKSN